MHVAPRWPLVIAAHVLDRVSSFTKKRPLLTPELVKLLDDVSGVSSDHKRKKKKHLGYESASLDRMIADCHDWLVAEGKLPARASA